MYKGIFTDSDLLYRIDVINSIDFYAMGFDMMRGETYARNALQWPQQERTDVLIVNVRLEDMSGFELAERIRRQMPQVKVIFLADSPDGADAQAAVRFGAFDYVLKSDGIDALRAALSRAAEELCAERRENAYCAARPIGMRLFQSSCACLRPCGRKSAKSIGSCTPESSRWFPMIHSASRRCWCVR